MYMATKIVDVSQVGVLVKDGANIAVSGISGTMVAAATLNNIEKSFLATGHPRDLTLVYPAVFGSATDGPDNFAHEGMLRRVIGGSYHARNSPRMCELVRQGKIEGYVLPLGVFYQLIRDIAAGLPGSLSHVGLGTFIDPRQEGGRLNAISRENLVELVNIHGREMLFYTAFPIDVAVIKGSTADEDGNISLEEEPNTADTLHMAIAAHNSGGIVICQVKRTAARGSLHPRMVEVPGILVDYVVVDPAQKQRAESAVYEPGLCGQVRVPAPPVAVQPLNADKIISRRALMELPPGALTNLGGGIPNKTVPLIAREEGVAGNINFTVEHGALGGINLGSRSHLNPTSLLTSCDIMDLYHGGGLDWSFLGFMEVDKAGNVNLGRLGKDTEGPGGCIDIASSTRQVAFIGNFTNGLEISVTDGKLRILKEGKTKKFVNHVQGIFYNSARRRQLGQRILYITERAVFELRDTGIELIEIAPGIDLEKDVVGQMEFRPDISRELKLMAPAIFRD